MDDFTASRLSFEVTGEGVAVDPGTGRLTIDTDKLRAGVAVTVVATDAAGGTVSRLRLTLATADVDSAPALVVVPTLAGTPEGKGVVGTPVTLDPGTWDGVPAPELAVAWLLDGAVLDGATGASYTLAAADEGKSLAARVTATNVAGEASAETAALAIVHAAPRVVAPLADVAADAGAAPVAVATAAAFAGAALTFAVSGTGATVDSARGVVTIATDQLLDRERITVTATNSGGSAQASFTATVAERIVPPALVRAPALAGTGRIGAPVTVSAGRWSGAPAPTTRVEWLLDGAVAAGATGARYTPVAADDGKSLAARVTATNAGGSAETVTAALAITYAPPVAKGGLAEEIFDLGSGVQTVAAGADFTGEGLVFLVTGAGARIDARTGLVSIPTDRAVQATVTVTATNSGGSASASFQVTVEAEDIPFALEAYDVEIVTSVWRPEAQETWLTPVVRFVGLADETVDAIEWTTSGADPIPDAEHEVVTKVGPDSYQLYMRDAAKNAPGASQRVDYSVFRLDETGRRAALRFRWRRTAEGPWSAHSPAFSVPAPTPAGPTGWKKRWIPMVTRGKEGYDAGIIDGPGMQFLRSFATTPAKPGLILAAMDVNFQWASDDFGETFYTPSWNGQFAGRQGLSVWIDPEDWKRQLSFCCVNPNGASDAEKNTTGIYLSTDGGETCRQVLSCPLTYGTASIRHNFQVIAHAPGTSTIYAMVSTGSSSGPNPLTDIQLWRSTDGGETWAKRGSSLYTSGSSGPYGILCDPSGNLYQYGPEGVWRSTDGGLSWTKATGIPGNRVHHMQIASTGDVWVAVDDNGLYKSTNGISFSKNAAFGTADIRAFAISPADDNYMVAAKVGTPDPFYSTNGGASWTRGVSHPRLGQEYDRAESVGAKGQYGIIGKHGDRETFFFHEAQHFGLTTDHGQNVYHAGMLFDGSHTRGDIGYHPTDWLQMACGQQDRGSIVTQNGGDYWLHDNVGSKTSGPGAQITTAADWGTYISGAGVLMHSSGRYVFQAGKATGKRVPVIVDQNYGGGGSTDPAFVVTNKLSSLSDNAALDPNNPNRGYSGEYRLDNLDAANPSGVTFTGMAQPFVGLTGAGGQTVLYGGGADRNIYRSASNPPGASWSLWATASQSFRPVDNRPEYAVCPHHPARVYALSGPGYLVKIEGVSNPRETRIFDARDYVSGAPYYQCHSVAVDPFDEDLGYVSLYMWGCPNVFRTRNLTAAKPTWESIATGFSDGLPHLDLELSVHPLTSDVLACGSHGTFVCKPPAGHQETYGITHSLWDRIAAYLADAQAS